ncbi:Conjugative transposon protein TraM [Mucinivorans hirudinis]|uniref:Conjugative transposon protein TraM n=1 Tax=Mucinivorans hirudinis TaxID=1433126 RepID=A0A060RA62_9BACT|nr:Conjugative transposon protein TraM [Mucinivorans hirudinis]
MTGSGCLAYGIFIPSSMEMSAIKEVAANMGAGLGSSINILKFLF